MRYINRLLLVILILGATVIVGCAAKVEKYGQTISNYQITAVKDIFAETKNFEGKTVTIEGKITNECSTGCWFFVKIAQGNLSIYVDTGKSGFAIPQYTGRKVLVEGVVLVKKSGPMIQAKGVEVR